MKKFKIEYINIETFEVKINECAFKNKGELISWLSLNNQKCEYTRAAHFGEDAICNCHGRNKNKYLINRIFNGKDEVLKLNKKELHRIEFSINFRKEAK